MEFNYCPQCGKKLKDIPYPKGHGWGTRKECPKGHKVEIILGDYGSSDHVSFPEEWKRGE